MATPAAAPDGRGVISNHEYFALQVKAVYALIGEVTEHGFVFRVDLALRPNGNSGPPAVSLGALEEYFQVQGREWERFAWLKSRVVAPPGPPQRRLTEALRQLVLPFVFSRYLDYNVFESLRVLHRQIREQAARRAAGHPERANDVKLSRGGIREIEFTVQLLQVVRGGQFPSCAPAPRWMRWPASARPASCPGHGRAPWRRPMISCAGSSTGSSTLTTSKPMCCPPRMPTWPGSRPPWALPTPARFWPSWTATASSWPRNLTSCWADMPTAWAASSWIRRAARHGRVAAA
jgi:hypothetical protein